MPPARKKASSSAAQSPAALHAVVGTDESEVKKYALDLAAQLFAAAETTHARIELELDARAADIEREREPLNAEKARLEAAVDPRPQPAPGRGEREDGRPGAPFWQLVDFAESLGQAERAAIEGALEGAGVLDAWVFPDGRLLGPGSDDVALVPAPIAPGPTLADHLRPAPGEPAVAGAVVDQLLRSIGCAAYDGHGLAVGLDGRYAFGPARGRHPKQRAQYIGAAARAENRARRLVELETALAQLARADEELTAGRASLAARRRRAVAERERFPSEQQVRDTHAAHVRAALDAEAARRAFEAADAAAIDAERAADLTVQDIEIVAGRHQLDPRGDEAALELVSEQVDRYADGLGALREAHYERRAALQMLDQLAGDVADAVDRRERQAAELGHAETTLRSEEGQLDGLRMLSQGAERALEAAVQLKAEIGAGDRNEKQLTRTNNELIARAAALEREAGHAA